MLMCQALCWVLGDLMMSNMNSLYLLGVYILGGLTDINKITPEIYNHKV